MKLCFMDTDSFIVYIKTEDIYPDIPKGVETRFYTSSYELDRQLPKGKNKKVIGLITEELGGIMTEVPTLRPKAYSYLTDNTDGNKKAKRTKKCITKEKLKFEDYEYCL